MPRTTKSLDSFKSKSLEEISSLVKKYPNRTAFLKGERIHSNYGRNIKAFLIEIGVDLSHWEPTVYQRTSNSRKGLEALAAKCRSNFEEVVLPRLFIQNSPFSGKTARAYISRWNRHYNWLPHICECGNTGEWRGRPLTLQIDHKNGDSTDHRLENLRYICPNCHAQTATFTGRNIRVGDRKRWGKWEA